MNFLSKRLLMACSVLGVGLGLLSPNFALAQGSSSGSSNGGGNANPAGSRDTNIESDPTQAAPNSPNNGSSPNLTSPNNSNTAPSRQPANSFSASNYSGMTIDQVVRTDPSFELFNALLRVAQAENALTTDFAGTTDYTVFAPTDQALAAIPPATFKALVQPENRALLARLLENHVVRGKVTSRDLVSKQVQSMGGNAMTAQGGTGAIVVGGNFGGTAQVIGPDLQTSNGIIHVVDRVIIPADLQSRLSALSGSAASPTMNR